MGNIPDISIPYLASQSANLGIGSYNNILNQMPGSAKNSNINDSALGGIQSYLNSMGNNVQPVGLGQETANINSFNTGSSPAVLKFPSTVTEPYYLFSAYKWGFVLEANKAFKVNLEQNMFNIALYAPGGAIVSYGLTWEDIQNSVIMGVPNKALTGLNNLAKQQLGISTSSPMFQSIQGGIRGKLGGSNTNMTLAPDSIQMFKGTDYITFDETFDLFPQSPQDAQLINKIVSSFQSVAVPNVKEENIANVHAYFMEFPYIFKIQLMSTAGVYIEYPYMVMTKMTITYSDGEDTFLIYNDGAPVATKLNLTFTSLQPAMGNNPVQTNSTPTNTITAGQMLKSAGNAVINVAGKVSNMGS